MKIFMKIFKVHDVIFHIPYSKIVLKMLCFVNMKHFHPVTSPFQLETLRLLSIIVYFFDNARIHQELIESNLSFFARQAIYFLCSVLLVKTYLWAAKTIIMYKQVSFAKYERRMTLGITHGRLSDDIITAGDNVL